LHNRATVRRKEWEHTLAYLNEGIEKKPWRGYRVREWVSKTTWIDDRKVEGMKIRRKQS